MPTYEERLREIHKRRFEADPSIIREVGYAGEAARERPEEETPLLTNIPERVTRERPTMFIGETPEEVRGAKAAGAERAILGRPPTMEFDKFGEPIIRKGLAAPKEPGAPRGPVPSKEDMDLNEKWTDFRENYLIPKIGYDPRTINPVQERISAENSIMGQVDINALDVDQYTKLKKESEKKGKQAEELAKEKMRIGKDKETQAFELFKKDISARPKEPRLMSLKQINDYLYKMTHSSDGSAYELSPTDLVQLQQMAQQSGYEVVEDVVSPGKENPWYMADEEKQIGYFVRPLGETGAAPSAKQYQHYAVNPQTKERIGWDGTKWEKVQ